MISKRHKNPHQRTVAYAPGKVILFGEHAVVYGRPAIAVPVTQVWARAEVEARGQGLTIVATDLGRRFTIGESPLDEALRPLQATVSSALEYLGLDPDQNLQITVTSTVPMARGLGSGAAVAAAMVKALAQHFGRSLSPQEVSDLVYETEVIHHGTPSGIDNTVIAFEQAAYFVRGKPIERFVVKGSLILAIGDTGIASPTKIAVGDVRRAWERDRIKYEALFDEIGEIVREARLAIEGGELEAVGRLMDENHRLLTDLGVSSPELEALVKAARAAGALGAKLSGAGRGGNMIALCAEGTKGSVVAALREAGATNVLLTEVR